MDWFLYDRDHRHERVNFPLSNIIHVVRLIYKWYQPIVNPNLGEW